MARVNNFVENGGRLCRTLARSVSVDVDPNARKKIPKIFRFFSGGYPGFSQPAKTAYQHRERFGNGLGKSNACVGCVWCEVPSSRLVFDTARRVGRGLCETIKLGR